MKNTNMRPSLTEVWSNRASGFEPYSIPKYSHISCSGNRNTSALYRNMADGIATKDTIGNPVSASQKPTPKINKIVF